MIKATDLLNYDLKPFLSGVLFSRIMGDIKEDIPNHFYVYTNFRSSKAVNYGDFNFMEYSKKLINKYNSLSGYQNWITKSVTKTSMELRFYIENDLNITIEEFYNLIYKKTMKSDWIHEFELNHSKRQFLIGFMETRGSIDIKAAYISQDYYYNNSFELKRIQIITDFLGISHDYVNFNPRNLQNDFVTGKNKRNTQFRINLHYYARYIGFVNEYKSLIYEKIWNNNGAINDGIIEYNVEIPQPKGNSFIKYLNFFTNNIYKADLTNEMINNMRESLGFNKDSDGMVRINRDRTIIELFSKISPNKCGLCGTTTTYTNSRGEQAFEIHHVIPFHNGQKYDNIANLIKLCPTCHSSFKKGRSSKNEQTKNLVSILHKHPEIFEYTSSALGINDINDLSIEIWKILG